VAGGAHEFLDAPTGSVFDQAVDGHGGEHDRQVGIDGFASVVVSRPGLQVMFGRAEGPLDAPQLVLGVYDELRDGAGEAGGASVPPCPSPA
jgi:hypothetical protein